MTRDQLAQAELAPGPALFFHPDQVEGEGRDLVGRRSAGESFLRGWLRHHDTGVLRFVVTEGAHDKALREKLESLGEKRPVLVQSLRGGSDFASAGTIFFPTPGYDEAAWLRQRLGPTRCSLVGITHTVSTRRIIEGLHQLMAEPVEAWDAIICTSRAVQSVMVQQFRTEAAYFRQRFGATRVPQPQLPVIPLGINAEDFAPRPGARAALRAKLEAPEDAVVIMTMGRLSVVEKANPLPLFVAAEAVAREIGRPLHLWLCGWASRPEEDALHREGAAAICRNVTVRHLDGRNPEIRRDIWAAADIFTLPSDSIQETYGLVPVEAMAAGLPVVMPDWDGFRDTVLDGRTGFLIPTRMARPGTGAEIGRRFADGTDGYLQYLSLVQAQVQIDVPSYGAALTRLATDPDLRARMGAAGRAHVAARLDWQAVVPQYLFLAEQLEALRHGAEVTTPHLPGPAPSPLQVDPFTAYADYPTAPLDPATRLRPGQQANLAAFALADKISGRDFYKRRLMAPAQALAINEALREMGSATIAELAAKVSLPVETVEIAALLLAKSDFLRMDPPRRDPDAAEV